MLATILAIPYLGSFLIGVGVIISLLVVALIANSITHIFVYIRNDEYGIVERLWSVRGSVKTGFMSLDNSAGYKPDLLRGGPHFFWPCQYRVHRQKLITVRNLAYVFARDGIALPPGQTLAKTPESITFENARAFLEGGGQRGPQRTILREGIYAINTALFVVMTYDATYALDIGQDEAALKEMRQLISSRNGFEPVIIRDKDDMIGVVTVHDGPVLEHGAIIAPAVGTNRNDTATFHNSFQDIEKFLAAGGWRGRQEQPLVEGTYFINRLFATVEPQPKKTVDIGTVGVVVSYTGDKGDDVSGADYRHGSLVTRGQRGVWAEPLPPGKYPFNPYAYNIISVPTINFVLRWIEGRREDHGLDTNLAEISLITHDGFEPLLPLSIVVHISPENAPRLIQQFAKVEKLVDQTIDPMVSAYFKDAAQTLDMMDFIQRRSELQAKAKEEMQRRFAPYNIEIMEVLIGTPKGKAGDARIVALLDQIRDRQLAVEQKTTYISQRAAAEEQQNLKKAQAAAEQQTALTESVIQIEVAQNQGLAELRRKEQTAAGIRVTAEAEAFQTVQKGEAEAKQIRAIGQAEGDAIKAKVSAFTGEGAEFQLRQTIAEILGHTIENTQQPLVPSVLINGSSGDGQTGDTASMISALVAMTLGKSAGHGNGLVKPKLEPEVPSITH